MTAETPRNDTVVDTVVIGAGQAGLSTSFHLTRRGLPHVILDANERVGDPWRNRWDSLRLFTPARFDGLDGMPVPAASPHEFITKDEMASYLESYAQHFDLPIESSVRVDRLSRNGDGRFELSAGDRRYSAKQVVVAMSNFQSPRVPAFATELDPSIVQLHSQEYRSPAQLRDGGVLLVGAGNSGAEIAREVVEGHETWLSGRDVGQVPFNIDSFAARHLLLRMVIRGLFHRVMTVRTPMGRRMRPSVLSQGGPLIRIKGKHLDAAGVHRVPRTAGVEDGKPVLEDGRVLDVANVIWCTGYHPGFSWIDLPVLGEHEPKHRRGVVEDEPGLYFVGLEFLYSFSSTMIHGVGRDAEHVVKQIEARTASAAA